MSRNKKRKPYSPYGAPSGIRTRDPLIKSQLLYHLPAYGQGMSIKVRPPAGACFRTHALVGNLLDMRHHRLSNSAMNGELASLPCGSHPHCKQTASIARHRTSRCAFSRRCRWFKPAGCRRQPKEKTTQPGGLFL